MSSSSVSKTALLVGSMVALASSARADDNTAYLAKGAYFALTADNMASDLELGMAFTPDAQLRLRPYARVPFSDGDNQVVRVDGHAQAAKIGVGVDLLEDWTGPTGPATFLVVGGQAELGTSVYDYSPAGTASASQRHQSISARAQVRFGVLWPGTLQIAPQLSVGYDRNYVAASAVGLVVPGSSGGPETVQMTVVDPPSVTPVLTVRAGTPWYHGALHAPVGFGTYVVASFAGTQSHAQPWGDGDTIRGELWTYLFVTSPTNARAGLALFAESTRATAEASATTSYGLFVQLKANTTLFEY